MSIRCILKLLPILLTIMAFLIIPQAYAEEDTAPIGTIIEVEGSATRISRENALTAEILKPDMPVYLYDKLQTGTQGRLLILFIDDSQLTIGENAVVKIDEYIFDPDAMDDSKTALSIMQGAFIFMSGLIAKRPDPDVTIDTAYGSIGLRGTQVWGGQIENEYGIFVEDGEVSVATERGRINVPKGMGTFIRNRQSLPSRAQQWSPETIDMAKKRIALKHKERVLQRLGEKRKNHKAMVARHQEITKKRRELIRDKVKEGKKQDIRERIKERRKSGETQRPRPRPQRQRFNQ